MPSKKYQVFISSTFNDLKDERQDISRSILNLDHIPAGMELFPAIDEDQFEYIKKVIDDCDYYVLIIGARYGSISENGISFTEREYDYAIDKGLKVIALIHSDISQITVAKSDTDPKIVALLNAFREKARTGRMVRFWTDRAGLRADFIESFTITASRFPAIGWVRGDTPASENLLAQINAVRDENDRLKETILKDAVPSKVTIPDLAEIGDEFEVRIIFNLFQAGYASEQYSQVRMRWGEIFMSFASLLLKPSSPTIIRNALLAYIRQNGLAGRIDGIVNSSLNTIKVHFMALGFIELCEAGSDKDSIAEFLRLTPEGKNIMLQLQAVRKN